MYGRALMRGAQSTLQRTSTGFAAPVAASVTTQSRRISIAANPTVVSAREAGHTTSLLSPHESAMMGRQGHTELGWSGGGAHQGRVPPTTFQRSGVTHTFPGVHNTGQLDSARGAPRSYRDVEHLAPLNETGGTAAHGFEQEHVASGTTYMTTHKSGTFNNKRTMNCVGFQEGLVARLSGVHLGLDAHAMPQDVVEGVRKHKALIMKGMEMRGHIDPEHTADIPWVNTVVEQAIVNRRNRLG